MSREGRAAVKKRVEVNTAVICVLSNAAHEEESSVFVRFGRPPRSVAQVGQSSRTDKKEGGCADEQKMSRR